MKRNKLFIPLLGVILLLAIVIPFAVAASYLGGLLDPSGNAQAFPIVYVNEDRGGNLNGQQSNLGDEIVKEIQNTNAQNPQGNNKIEWIKTSSREDAVKQLQENQYAAAIIIPRDYTQRIGTLENMKDETSKDQTIALEILTNPASGSISGSESSRIATGVAEKAAYTVLSALPDPKPLTYEPKQPETPQELQQFQQQLATDPQAVIKEQSEAAATFASAQTAKIAQIKGSLQESMLPDTTELTTVGEHAGRGIAPFYFALMLSLAGYLSMAIIHLGLDFLTGEDQLELMGRKVRFPHIALTHLQFWLIKTGLALGLAIVLGSVLTWLSVNLLQMPVSNGGSLVLFSILSILAIELITLVLLTLFGKVGMLLALFLTTILGVPAAGGIYPMQMIPGFFRWVATWIPLRYMTDGVRSIVFFGGDWNVGLGNGVWVMASYTVGAFLLTAVMVLIMDMVKRPARHEEKLMPAT